MTYQCPICKEWRDKYNGYKCFCPESLSINELKEKLQAAKGKIKELETANNNLMDKLQASEETAEQALKE